MDGINPDHLWSEVDEKPFPVDPADCDDCVTVNGKWHGPCFNHYCMGAGFHNA